MDPPPNSVPMKSAELFQAATAHSKHPPASKSFVHLLIGSPSEVD
jgi:hypothetical protein